MTIDLEQAIAGLNRLANLNMSPWMQTAAKTAQTSVQQRIRDTKADPDNSPWSPWRPATEKYRLKKGNAGQGLLWDSGALLNSIQGQSDAGGISVGTAVGYAGYLQDGTERMVARQFMGWTDGEITQMEFSAVAFLEALL
ncbi:MAG: phage virion morphogenesis protein [Xanthobacteraceae bacterium]